LRRKKLQGKKKAKQEKTNRKHEKKRKIEKGWGEQEGPHESHSFQKAKGGYKR